MARNAHVAMHICAPHNPAPASPPPPKKNTPRTHTRAHMHPQAHTHANNRTHKFTTQPHPHSRARAHGRAYPGRVRFRMVGRYRAISGTGQIRGDSTCDRASIALLACPARAKAHTHPTNSHDRREHGQTPHWPVRLRARHPEHRATEGWDPIPFARVLAGRASHTLPHAYKQPRGHGALPHA